MKTNPRFYHVKDDDGGAWVDLDRVLAVVEPWDTRVPGVCTIIMEGNQVSLLRRAHEVVEELEAATLARRTHEQQ